MLSTNLNRRNFLLGTSAAGVAAMTGSIPTFGDEAGASVFPAKSLAFLKDITAATLDASRVAEDQSVVGSAKNTTGGPLVRPGGRGAYPSFWVRDYAMSLQCGLMTEEETVHGFLMIARTQQGPKEWKLDTGAFVPPYAIADHVNFDGKPVFYPGTYSSGPDQGGGIWGVLPPIDDHYYFIHAGHYIHQAYPDKSILAVKEKGMTVLERMRKAFDASGVDKQTGLAATSDDRRAVGFGFCDTIAKAGSLLFCSLLRWRAAIQLSAMCQAAGDEADAKKYQSIASQIQENIPKVFCDPENIGGWLRAATVSCRQPDVWGTLFALELGVLDDETAMRARQTIADAVERGTIEYLSGVRHVPTDHDFNAGTAWERAAAPLNRYQNGAYWHTPTGWLINAVRPVSAPMSDKLFKAYIEHLRVEDFRQGPQKGAPWECFHKEGQGYQTPVYKTSVTLPYGALKDA